MAIFFKLPLEPKQIEDAIARLELQTSAELRVCVERKIPITTEISSEQQRQQLGIQRATYLFNELKMDQTAARNGVLIYLALKQKCCAVIGDKAIDEVVDDTFWQQQCSLIAQAARQGNYTQGIVNVIEQIGERLAQHFPRQADDINELPNEVVIK
ncbi:hypothetical protein CEP48_06030 [Mergibacter septicus]|uniref:TPM domain-containing protein n=1 Tax=Mergibacter septicus TaxID=221402 RepID=A0A8D4IXQ4_9PAST|nr:TPM domain-containing protein [Mergibacter septicus]AWX13758.1 hypothetical protein CEP49_03910 [Mergibacter septicus]AWX15758.1 hypothetical protein CEP47_06030 [Mergibacter septicus]QDJ15011.1 hypothetical protein CEP48_06030 [Mergibacter septicus]UTU47564.1 TPM domain-containing protein [Mergibacter septicus]WMR95255.1 TPM domain-containing protein [Mergibacter septicus]